MRPLHQPQDRISLSTLPPLHQTNTSTITLKLCNYLLFQHLNALLEYGPGGEVRRHSDVFEQATTGQKRKKRSPKLAIGGGGVVADKAYTQSDVTGRVSPMSANGVISYISTCTQPLKDEYCIDF